MTLAPPFVHPVTPRSHPAVPGPAQVGQSLLVGTARVERWVALAGTSALPFRQSDGVQLLVVMSGAVTLLGENEKVRSGGIVLLRGRSRYPVEVPVASHLLAVALPSDVLHGVVELSARAPIVIARSTVLTRAIVAFFAEIAEGSSADISGVDRYAIERFLHEMVTALLLDRAHLNPMPRRRDIFEEAKVIVLACCTDASLDVERLAAECNVSLRTLEREFSKHDTNARAEIRRARVEHATSLLCDPQYDALSVDQIAMHSGFSNGSSLARAMRAVASTSPASVRRNR